MICSDTSSSEAEAQLLARSKQRRGLGFSRLAVAVACVGAAMLLYLALNSSLRIMRAVSILHHRDTKPLVLRVYDHFFNFPFSIIDTAIQGAAGPVQIRVYTPIGVQNPAPIVLIHGFAPIGDRDLYLNWLAGHFARVGFMVVMPTVPGESHVQMLPTDLTVIGDTIRWTARQSGQQVSIMGVSFGGGIVVPAGAQPSVAGDVKLIVSISGYNDLESIARYYMHEQVMDPSGEPYPGTSAGPLMITSPYLAELVPPQDLSALLPIVTRVDQDGGQPLPSDDPDLLRLNPRQRQELTALELVNTPEARELYLKLVEHHAAEFKTLSPSSVIRNLRIPLFEIHGTYDPSIPEGEIEWMRLESAGNPNLHILITPWLEHVTVGQPATTWQKLRFIYYCAGMFSQAAKKVPVGH
jgi:acetyl esterase/lipase